MNRETKFMLYGAVHEPNMPCKPGSDSTKLAWHGSQPKEVTYSYPPVSLPACCKAHRMIAWYYMQLTHAGIHCSISPQARQIPSYFCTFHARWVASYQSPFTLGLSYGSQLMRELNWTLTLEIS